MINIKVMVNVILFTCIIGLAVSYVTTLIPGLPKLNFLEAVGVYCLWTPLHHGLTSMMNRKSED